MEKHKMVVTAYRSDAVSEKTDFLTVFFNMEGIVHSEFVPQGRCLHGLKF
jgi:hypothetical protein